MTKYFHDQWRRIRDARFEFEQVERIGYLTKKLIIFASIGVAIPTTLIIDFYLKKLSFGRTTSVTVAGGAGGLLGGLTKEGLTKLISERKENPYAPMNEYSIRQIL